jgi:hypothetical protein
MRKFLSMFLAAGLFVAAPLAAYEQPEVKPGPEHAKLKESEGTWDATIKGKDGDSKGVLQCKLGLNGLWLVEHFKADLGGKPFEGHGATSYDAGKKKYVNVWVDSMATLPMVSEGTFDSKTKTLKLSGEMPMPDGKTMKCTMTTIAKDADTKVFTLTGVQDGKDFEMVHITYKRRK